MDILIIVNIIMEPIVIDHRSSPSSWSTCDLSSQTEFLHQPSSHYSKTDWKATKKELPNLILSWLKSQCGSSFTKIGLLSAIEDIFTENLDFLIEKFRYNCCLKKRHGSSCFSKWKKIKERVKILASEISEDEKPIFKITRREKSAKNLLLDKSQPFWVHRILVGNFFCFDKY